MGYELADIVREDYPASYVGERMVDQMAFTRSFPTELPVLGGLLGGIETPVQIIAGRDDHIVPLGSAEYLHERLPDGRLDVIDSGDYVWEQSPDTYARIVTDWWQAH
jgi:pimeloyl-ACP methyl ester carboxylesterase